LFCACTSTSIFSRIFVFEYFSHTFPITLKFNVEMFATCTQNYIYFGLFQFVIIVRFCYYYVINLNIITLDHLYFCAIDTVYFDVSNL
jgi:hypothetical protein